MNTEQFIRAISMLSVTLAASVANAYHALPQHPVTKVALTPPFTVGELLRSDTTLPFTRSPIEQSLSKADLPRLYAELDDSRPSTNWSKVLQAICVLEDGSVAIEVVKRFVSTPWDWRKHNYTGFDAVPVVMYRMWCVRNLALVDPTISGPFLTPLLEKENAFDLLKNWQTLPFPMNSQSFEEVIVNKFREGVALALIHTRSPELFAVVEQAYQTLDAQPESRTRREDNSLLLDYMMVIGEHEIYREKGWEEGAAYLKRLDGSDTLSSFGTKGAAFERYYDRMHPWKTFLNKQVWPWFIKAFFLSLPLGLGIVLWRKRKIVFGQPETPVYPTEQE